MTVATVRAGACEGMAVVLARLAGRHSWGRARPAGWRQIGAEGHDERPRQRRPPVRMQWLPPCADQPDAASFRTRAATEFMCRNSLCIAATMAT